MHRFSRLLKSIQLCAMWTRYAILKISDTFLFASFGIWIGFFFFVFFLSFVQFTHDFRVVVKKFRDIWTKWWITCSLALWFFLLANWTGCTSTCALSFCSLPSLFLYLLCSPSKEGSSGITQNLGYMCVQCLLTFNLLLYINTNALNYWCVLSIE